MANRCPFYSLDSDYTPGEINTEDIQFLIWHYHMQLNNLDIAYSPALDTFAAIAADVMELFEAEYETAPENEKLLHYLQPDEKEQHNLYALHARFLWLCTQSYLFSNNGYLLEDQAEALADEAKENGLEDQIPDMVNQLCNDFGFNQVHRVHAPSRRPTGWPRFWVRNRPSTTRSGAWATNTPATTATKGATTG